MDVDMQQRHKHECMRAFSVHQRSLKIRMNVQSLNISLVKSPQKACIRFDQCVCALACLCLLLFNEASRSHKISNGLAI